MNLLVRQGTDHLALRQGGTSNQAQAAIVLLLQEPDSNRGPPGKWMEAWQESIALLVQAGLCGKASAHAALPQGHSLRGAAGHRFVGAGGRQARWTLGRRRSTIKHIG